MSSRPRVLLVSSSYGGFGGIQTFMLALARALREGGEFEPLLCFKRFEPFAMEPGFEQALDATEVAARFVNARSGELLGLVRDAAVVHAQTPSADVAILARATHTPLALTLHEFRSAASVPRLLAAKLAIRLAERRWFTSDYVGETWGLLTDHRGGRMPVVSELPTSVIAPEARRGFVFIGRWIEGKGIEDLVEAYGAAALDRAAWPLTLVGDGPLRATVDQRVHELGIDQDVRRPGFLHGARRDESISSAKWMVVPSNRREPLGLAAIEGRNVGVPCIVSRDGGLPEAAGTNALVHEPGDVGGLRILLERAARMTESDYVRLSEQTRRELRTFLRPLTVYADSYRELITTLR